MDTKERIINASGTHSHRDFKDVRYDYFVRVSFCDPCLLFVIVQWKDFTS